MAGSIAKRPPSPAQPKGRAPAGFVRNRAASPLGYYVYGVNDVRDDQLYSERSVKDKAEREWCPPALPEIDAAWSINCQITKTGTYMEHGISERLL